MSIEDCVADYVQRFKTEAGAEMAFYKTQPTLSHAIKIAANSIRADGKRHPHQRRIPAAVLNEAERRLLASIDDLETAQHFDQLHIAVNHVIRPIFGIGELAVYDVAHRIGAFLGLEPEKVYLHAGARSGAAVLGVKGKMIEKDQLPSAFALLTAAEIEDCLCNYKDALRVTGHLPAGCGAQGEVSSCLPKERQRRSRC